MANKLNIAIVFRCIMVGDW